MSAQHKRNGRLGKLARQVRAQDRAIKRAGAQFLKTTAKANAKN